VATAQATTKIVREERETLQEPRKTRPVLGWAAVGVVFVGVFVYTMGGWILSGDAQPAGRGPTPVPTYMVVNARLQEIGGVIGALLILYFVLIRPWRREGHITQDGLFIFAFLALPWQDSALNYFTIWNVFNTAYINLGGWDRWIPGFMAPHGNLVAEPLVWDFPFYVWAAFGGTVVACWLLRKVQARWPGISTFRLMLAAFGMGFVGDFVIEFFVWVLPGTWTYPGAIEGLTLFHGHYYQFPLYEPVFIGLLFSSFAFLRLVQNDKGQTIVERGIDEVRVSTRTKAWIRWAALVGVINLITLVTYNIPMAFLGAAFSSPWPEDIVKRSYFVNQICGPGTDYACPGPGVPIPRRGSAHLNPEGELVVPDRQCWPQACAGVPNK
jgi:hypothetical protein